MSSWKDWVKEACAKGGEAAHRFSRGPPAVPECVLLKWQASCRTASDCGPAKGLAAQMEQPCSRSSRQAFEARSCITTLGGDHHRGPRKLHDHLP
eukprot:6429563-Heterocapsa_arctica.AAC.1